jgi:hypothetical protein
MISIFNGRSRSLGASGGEDVHLQVSVDLRKHLHLFKGAKLGVFMAIALHSDKDGWSHPSTAVLRKETGFNPDTIFKALDDLCDLQVEGHRVLLRKGVRQSRGQFSNNHYLIFPTAEEIAKYETPYLFTVSEKPDMVKTRQGKNPTRKKPVSEKSDTEVDPLLNQNQKPLLTKSLQSNQNQTHTQDPEHNRTPLMRVDTGRENRVCETKSKFDIETIRNYAFAAQSWTMRWNSTHPGEKLDSIRNVEGWSFVAHRSGNYDAAIAEYVEAGKDHYFHQSLARSR